MTTAEQVDNRFISTFAFREDDYNDDVAYLGELVALGTSTLPLGDLSPKYIKDSRQAGNFKIVGKTRGAPGLGELQFNERVLYEVASYLEVNFRQKCDIAVIAALNQCGDPDELYAATSWLIHQGLNGSSIEFSELGTLEAEGTMVTVTGPGSFEDRDRALKILFESELEASTINAEILRVFYSGSPSCGYCNPYTDGCTGYAVMKSNSGSPGLSSQVLHIADADDDVVAYDVDTLGGLDASDGAAMGLYIVVVSEADGAHHYALKTDLNTWTRVVTGYQAGGSPRVIWANGSVEAYVGGAGGYIYKLKRATQSPTVLADGSGTTQNVNAIHGTGKNIVAVHDSNTISYSINGKTFAVITGPEVGANLTAVWVKNRYNWEVGTNTGKLWYTRDGGSTWTQRYLPNQDNLVVVNDIQYALDRVPGIVGAISVETLSAGFIYRTITGGREWVNDTNVIDGVPTNRRINSVAYCGINELLAGGLRTGSDGILLKGEG